MKTITCLLIGAGLIGNLACLRAQTPLPSGVNSNPQPIPLDWQVTARNSFSTTRQAASFVTNLFSGAVSTNLHQYIEVANGANFQDANGVWTESQDLIELTPDGGAAALRSGHQVFFSPNLNVSNAITLISDKGRTFQTRPAAICYYDSASDQRVIVAAPKDSYAELTPPNTLDYPGVFGQIGYMHYTVTKAGFESDLVFTSRPPDPASFAGPNGMNLNSASVTIEIWHEWYNAPVPQVNPHVIITNTNPALDVSDEVLDFGDLWFPTGKAYFTDDQSPRDPGVAAQIRIYNPADDTNSVPVAKHWIAGTNGGSSWLIESVNWEDIKPKLANLPELSQADVPNGAHGSPRQSEVAAGVTRPTQTAFTFPPPAPKEAAHSHAPAIKLASAKVPTPACVIDYTTLMGNITNNYVFSNSWTYFLPAEAVMGRNVTFQPNCIIKYSNNVDLLIYGSITCTGSSSSPSLLTSMYDSTVGESISGSASCPIITAKEAVWVYFMTNSVTISGMKIRFASRAIQFDYDNCGFTDTVSNSVLDSCGIAIYANNCTVSVSNVTLARVLLTSQTAGCGSVASLTTQTALADHIAFGMEALTNGLTPSTAEYIFNTTGPATNVTLTNMYYNTSSWVHGLKGLSSCAAGVVDLFTNGGGIVTTNFRYPNGPNCTLITPQHALTAWHTQPQVGGTYVFVGTNNVQYFATVTAMVEVITTNYYGMITTGGIGGNDIAVVEFSSPVDSHVQPASILTQTAIRKLPYLYWYPIDKSLSSTCLLANLPCIACNQHKQAIATDLVTIDLTSPQEPALDFALTEEWFPSWWITIPVPGDSGSPIWTLIQNELVLIGAWHEGPPEAPWCGYDFNTLNTTISNLCVSLGTTVYQATAKDLSAFPDL